MTSQGASRRVLRLWCVRVLLLASNLNMGRLYGANCYFKLCPCRGPPRGWHGRRGHQRIGERRLPTSSRDLDIMYMSMYSLSLSFLSSTSQQSTTGGSAAFWLGPAAQLQMKTSRLETQASRAKQELEKARARGDEYQEKWGILQVCLNTDCLGPRLLCWLISCSVV